MCHEHVPQIGFTEVGLTHKAVASRQRWTTKTKNDKAAEEQMEILRSSIIECNLADVAIESMRHGCPRVTFLSTKIYTWM